jgi:hypothetical protein
MPLVGSGLLGSPGASGGVGSAGVAFSELGMAAYRIAGITKWARIGPSVDMWAECIPAYNRMVGSWNCERPKIFTIRTDTVTATGATSYTVGSGADWDMPRPQGIEDAIYISGSSRTRILPMSRAYWAGLSVQAVTGDPVGYYFDESYDDSGFGRIYLYPQPGSGSIEWHTWQQLAAVASQDDTVALPPGYEEAIVGQLAMRLAALNPLIANMPEESRRLARKALAVLEAKNSKPPSMTSDFPGCGNRGPRTEFWRDGGF